MRAHKRQQREAVLRQVEELLRGRFSVTAVGNLGEEVIVRLEPLLSPDTPLSKIDSAELSSITGKLGDLDYECSWLQRSGGTYLRVRLPSDTSFPWTNILFFALTVVTVFFFPQYSNYAIETLIDLKQQPLDFFDWLLSPSSWQVGWGVSFTFWLLGILLAHEFGHYFAGKRRNLRLTLPFFIPFPNFIGTMGAVIRFKSPIENRRDLIEVGAAGPIAGFVVAVIAIWVGLLNTDPTLEGTFSFESESLLMTFMGKMILGESAFGHTLRLAPAAFADWVGVLITALNMLPLSQLDGGHITYGLFGKRQRPIAILAFVGLFWAGFQWPVWWFYGLLALFFKPFHFPTLDDNFPVPTSAKIIGWIALVIFALTLIIKPFGM
jgi:Peptidase family M50